MFFFASKILWSLLSPLNFILALVIAGIACEFLRWRRAGRVVFIVAIMLFAVIGILPVGRDLLVPLETKYPRPQAMPKAITGILILGGTMEGSLSYAHGFPIMGQNAQRIMEGVRLAEFFPHAKVIFTGGENDLRQNHHPESQDVRSFIHHYGLLPDNRVIYEEKSRNTAENFTLTRDLVHPRDGETWLLVTSASHLPRAMAAASADGWPPVIIPWPSTYLATDKWQYIPDDLNITGHFMLADVALHEYAGLLAYRLFHVAQ